MSHPKFIMKVYLILPAMLACASQVSCGILRGAQSYLPPQVPSSEYAVGYGSATSGGVSSAASSGYTIGSSNPGWSGSNSGLNQGWLELSSDQSSNQAQPSDRLVPTILNHGRFSSLGQISSESNGISALYNGNPSLGVHSNGIYRLSEGSSSREGLFGGLSGESLSLEGRGINSGIHSVNGLRPGNIVNGGATYSQRTETLRVPVSQPYPVPVNRPVAVPVEEKPKPVEETPQPVEVLRSVSFEVPQPVEETRQFSVPAPRPYPVTFRVNEYVEKPTQVRENVPVVVEKPYPARIPTRLEVNAPVPVNVHQSQSNVGSGQYNFGNSGFSSDAISGLGITPSYRVISGLHSGLSGGFGPIGFDSGIRSGLAGSQESGFPSGWAGNDPNVKSSSVCASGQVHSSVSESESSQSGNDSQNSLYDNNGGYRY